MAPRAARYFQLDIKRVSRNLAGASQFLYTQAILKQKTYRLVIDLSEQKYWVESTGSPVLFKKEELNSQGKYQRDKEIQPKDISLPNQVFFQKVYSARLGKNFESGKVPVYFFPHGYVDPVVIQLASKGGIVFSIITNPMTGHARVEYQAIEGEDAFKQ